VKIGIVNDRPMAVEALRRAIALKPEHQVIWVAADGTQAVELCTHSTPDLVLMDLVMPAMDGVEATRRIMMRTPCAILVVTSAGIQSNRAFEAMGCGALDAVDTPGLGAADLHKAAAPLLVKIDSVARMLESASDARAPVLRPRSIVTRRVRHDRLVVIGASAGGPAAVSRVLRNLPADFPAAIALVQHIDEQFAAGMAQWLNDQTALTVRLASEGDRLVPGTVTMAGTNRHLVFKSADRIGYSPEPADCVYRPSIDVFFQSVSEYWPGEVIGVLLTGMGRDGAVGLRALKNQGHYTIAQDESSSAVYGMPKAAARLNAAVDILSLDRIPSQLVSAITCAK
jgi:two-component system, chemotaxis family, response regulator WspF